MAPLVRTIITRIPVLLLKERRVFIAYSPAFDLSAHAATPNRAKKNFETALHLLLEELIESGTLSQVLRELGWTKREHHWQPPTTVTKATSVPFRIPVSA